MRKVSRQGKGKSRSGVRRISQERNKEKVLENPYAYGTTGSPIQSKKLVGKKPRDKYMPDHETSSIKNLGKFAQKPENSFIPQNQEKYYLQQKMQNPGQAEYEYDIND